MIAPHKENRDLIKLEQLFEVVIGQITAGKDQIDILELFIDVFLK